ncbi:MAG: hypothetical protein ACSI46_03720 [Gloeotrichia echinulata DVL01]
MSNPLHKNKVIQFIKRYPNSEDFSLTTGNQPLTESSNNTFKPGCSVGLSGKAGNPENFNDLIDMWVAGGLVRNNINPYGLMRLWAATYRTYYDWCRTVKRPYFNPVGSTISTQQRLLSLDEYEVKYTANLNSGSINGKTITGAFAKARRAGTGSSNRTLKYDDATKNDEYLLTPYIPESLYSTYEEANGTAIPYTRIDFPVGTIGTLYGGPIKCELLFNTSVDVDSILIGHHQGGSSNTASPSAPEGINPFNWFFPSNFKLRVSYDGVNYNGDFNYNSIINNLNQLVFTNKTNNTPINPFDWRQISSLSISSTYPDLITTLNNTSNYSSSVNSRTNLNTYLSNDPDPASPTSLNQTTYGFPNDTPFTTRIKSITSTIPGYDLSQFSVGRPLKGHEVEVVTVTQGSTPKTCIVRTWFRQDSVPRKLSSGSSNVQFIPAEYETNALFALNYGYFEVIDLSSGRICTGTCDPPFSFKGVRALELTSGINDNLLIRPYLAGMIRVRGSIKSFTTTFTGPSSTSNYTPNYLDSYWTNNSPQTFTLGGTQFSDEIANKAFLTVNYTGSNVDKWKRLPYTLPNSGIFLDNEVRLSSITIKNVPIDFDYTEDYINNKIISLPTDQELIDFETEALGLGRDPVLHYFRTKISAFLLELINYCKSTCLKFWQYGASTRSVSYYKTYTSQVLQIDNLGLPLDSLISSTIKVYEIPTGGDFDIERSDPAKRMWFLSGGEATRVDVDIAVLQKLLDISGITV